MNNPEASNMAIETQPKRKGFWRNLSLVWLVPIAALAASLYIAWDAYKDRGVEVEIHFENAQGVLAKETSIRYRDVVVGTVEEVGFSDDLSSVIVTARINDDVAPFLDERSQFWVVRPQVSARGVSGLSTVLSGVYIEGAWDSVPGEAIREFVGSEEPPLVQPGRAGRRITLRASEGAQVVDDAPVLFRGIEVGRLERPRLSDDGTEIVVDAFINAPHDQKLTTATRFWDTSGFTVSFGLSGFDLDFDSIASLVGGAVTFDTVYEGAEVVGIGHEFSLYPDEDIARRSVDIAAAASDSRYIIAFPDAINGLSTGADVIYGGTTVGYVTRVESQVSTETDDTEIRRIVEIGLIPEKLGLSKNATPEQITRFLDAEIKQGLRARVGVLGLLSQQLIVELVSFTDVDAAQLNTTALPFPEIPAVPSQLPDFMASAESTLARFNELPIEETMFAAVDLMKAVETVLRSDGVQQTPDAVLALIEDAQFILANEAIQTLPQDITTTLSSVNGVLEDLQRDGAIKALNRSLINLDTVVSDISDASTKLPGIVDDIQSLTSQASTLELDALIANAEGLLDSANALVSSDELREVPPALASALEQVSLALADLREGGAVENLNATLSSARDAATSISNAADDLPTLIARMDDVAKRADAVLASYGDRSPVQNEAVGALREMRDAARSVSDLARQLERNPNSILFGR